MYKGTNNLCANIIDLRTRMLLHTSKGHSKLLISMYRMAKRIIYVHVGHRTWQTALQATYDKCRLCQFA